MSVKKHDIGQFVFSKLKNVTKEIESELKTKYLYLEDLREADLKDIQKDIGVTNLVARRLKKYAMDLIADSDKKNADAVHTKISSPLDIGTKNTHTSPDEEEDEDGDDEEEQYVMIEKDIDKFNKKRSRILVTPAVCKICGFDLIARNRLVPYNELPENDQRIIREALEAHKKEVHSASNLKILKKSQLKDTSWLRPSL